MSLIDFSSCEIDKLADYHGSDQKRGVIYQGKRYMLKWSDRIPEEKRISLNSLYSNSVYSEYIGCHIAKMIGFDAQNTILGFINSNARQTSTELHMVIACENFVAKGKKLIEFKHIENSLLDTKPPKVPKVEHIYEIMTHINPYFTETFGKKALEQYWDVFILDALLGNFDRHANNWGYLVDEETKEIELAPVYDCGSCLYPQISDNAIPKILQDKNEIQMRIDKFPTAALVVKGKKVVYKEYISSMCNPDCNEALKRVFPKINMEQIICFVQSMDELSNDRKQFYTIMLTERYNQILKEAYHKLEMKTEVQCNTTYRHKCR